VELVEGIGGDDKGGEWSGGGIHSDGTCDGRKSIGFHQCVAVVHVLQTVQHRDAE
jgi:hypothetical protein